MTSASNRNFFIRKLVEKLSLDSCVNVRPIITQDRRDFLSVGLINRKKWVLLTRHSESYNRQYDRGYRSVMPTNLYSHKDNFHPENSHVILALIGNFMKMLRGKRKKLLYRTQTKRCANFYMSTIWLRLLYL